MQKEDVAVNRSRDAGSLRAACGREGCPICTVVLESMQRLMDTWQYEGFTDVEHRHELIRSRGFCPLHTWQLARQHNAFQLAVIYRDVLTDMLKRLNQDYSNLAPSDQNESGLESALKAWWRGWLHQPAMTNMEPAYDQCPLCQSRTSIEQRLIATLLELLGSQEIRTLLSQSTGLCQLHFSQACKQAEVDDLVGLRRLLECQRLCMQHVLEEVQELIRKYDYRFGDEPRGDEMTSWQRAAELCAGNPGVR